MYGNISYISNLTTRISSNKNTEYHSRIIKRKIYSKNKLIFQVTLLKKV